MLLTREGPIAGKLNGDAISEECPLSLDHLLLGKENDTSSCSTEPVLSGQNLIVMATMRLSYSYDHFSHNSSRFKNN